MYYLSPKAISDEDNRLDALEDYIAVSRDENGKEVDRDLGAITTCRTCVDFWLAAPQRRRARLAETAEIYRPSTVKPRRRTKAEIESLKNFIYRLVSPTGRFAVLALPRLK